MKPETKNIKTREDAVTKDMQTAGEVEQTFNFPTLGVTVAAKTYQEALEKAKEVIKAKK